MKPSRSADAAAKLEAVEKRLDTLRQEIEALDPTGQWRQKYTEMRSVIPEGHGPKPLRPKAKEM